MKNVQIFESLSKVASISFLELTYAANSIETTSSSR